MEKENFSGWFTPIEFANLNCKMRRWPGNKNAVYRMVRIYASEYPNVFQRVRNGYVINEKKYYEITEENESWKNLRDKYESRRKAYESRVRKGNEAPITINNDEILKSKDCKYIEELINIILLNKFKEIDRHLLEIKNMGTKLDQFFEKYFGRSYNYS